MARNPKANFYILPNATPTEVNNQVPYVQGNIIYTKLAMYVDLTDSATGRMSYPSDGALQVFSQALNAAYQELLEDMEPDD